MLPWIHFKCDVCEYECNDIHPITVCPACCGGGRISRECTCLLFYDWRLSKQSNIIEKKNFRCTIHWNAIT